MEGVAVYIEGSLTSWIFVLVVLLAVGGLCSLALLTRDLKEVEVVRLEKEEAR